MSFSLLDRWLNRSAIKKANRIIAERANNGRDRYRERRILLLMMDALDNPNKRVILTKEQKTDIAEDGSEAAMAFFMTYDFIFDFIMPSQKDPSYHFSKVRKAYEEYRIQTLN